MKMTVFWDKRLSDRLLCLNILCRERFTHLPDNKTPLKRRLVSTRIHDKTSQKTAILMIEVTDQETLI